MPASYQGAKRDEQARLRVSNDSETNSVTIPSGNDLSGTSAEEERTQSRAGATQSVSYEFIDSSELARRWDVPVSWIRDQVRKRAEDPLPHVNLGKYVRFLWGSPEIQAWIERRIVMGNNRRVGRVH
jgi:hypothetical protein